LIDALGERRNGYKKSEVPEVKLTDEQKNKIKDLAEKRLKEFLEKKQGKK